MVKAAVCTDPGGRLRIETLHLARPRPGEVAVRLGAAGLCGSDRTVVTGALPSPLPIVLGHQGAGVVVEIGAGVRSVAPGDHVVVVAVQQCGACAACVRGRPHLCRPGAEAVATGLLPDGSCRLEDADGAPVRQFMAAGTFADEIVVPAGSVVQVPDDLAFAPAAIIGCSALTGFGAAANTATIRPGDSVVVLGCGAVGLFAVQGARISDAGEIIAVDVAPAKLELARSVGATSTVHAGQDDVVTAVRELTGGYGADVVIEAVGSQAAVDQAIRATMRGGTTVFVGAGPADTRISVKQYSGLISAGKTLVGCFFGSADVQRDVPRIVELHRSGELELDRLVSRRLPLDQVNEGFAVLGGPDTVTAVIDFSGL
jgi:Zn-dependent alcohol dehydrogenase